jgi:hypothetical protein
MEIIPSYVPLFVLLQSQGNDFSYTATIIT